MKKRLKISMMILLIIVVGIIALMGLGIIHAPWLSNQSHEVLAADLPKDVPIINGRILSTKTTRSDDFTRGITIEVETNLSLKEAVQYYTDEFEKRQITSGQLPLFQGNNGNIENCSEAYAVGETKNRQGIVVTIKSESKSTLVTIQVKGNSIFFLPD